LMLGLLLWLVEELTLVIDFASVSTISLLSDGIVTLVEQELLPFEDTKGAIRNRISKKNRQHNGKKKYKRTNNDRQNIHIKLKIE
jgi:hypothetical protein